MENTKTKIILSAIVFLSVIGFVGTVNAVGSSLYVSPASLTKTAGNVFSVSVGFNASGNKVCAVEGTLVFNNLTCQSITVAGDVMAQSSPTCSNPHFLIGIPGCTTSDKALLTLSVKAENAGTASINATGVDIIGEGASVGSTSISGNYTIDTVPKPKPTPTQTDDGFVGYVSGKIQTFPTLEAAQQAGATEIQPNYQYSPSGSTPTPTPTEQITIPVQTPAVTSADTENTSAPSFLATILNFSTFGRSIRTIIIIVIIAFAIYSFIVLLRKKRKKMIL
ncbi:MAG: hypothetical protein V1686_00620 [Patescibacteria group bacterium]